MWRNLFRHVFTYFVVALSGSRLAVSAASPGESYVISLDGTWQLAVDPANEGREKSWFKQPRADAHPAKVPWVIQDTFPDYHGVVWYWREFTCPRNPDPQGRTLLKFWNVDYLGEVWVNGKYLGKHEGADGPFVLDATDAVRPEEKNLLAVRVLNPKDEPIDGIVLKETPHRNKTCAFTFGCDYNHGGLEDSVDLMVVPAVWIADLQVLQDVKTGVIKVSATVKNTLPTEARITLSAEVAPAADGLSIDHVEVTQPIKSGESIVEAKLLVRDPKLWDVDTPNLYRVTTRVSREGSSATDVRAVRCGFRDFRIENGYFTLNGKRMFLRCSHTGNTAPIGIHLPYDADWFRRDLLNVKAMGFNAIRFIAGLPTRQQLNFCDELGLLVYDEPYSAWLLENSPHMVERFDRSIEEMVRRDRNHASVVIWGVLNETGDGPVYRHAVETLPLVRKFDDSRLVLLSSGRFDCQLETGSVANPGSSTWQPLLGAEGTKPAKELHTIYPSCEGAGDAHIYPQVPHSAEAIRILRHYGEGQKPFFLSEYGVSSPVDLIRVARQFEQRGKESCREAKFYREALDKFQADWQRWKLDEVFGRPEEFFRACQSRMATQRLLGINAIRSNPACNGYSLTGTVDQGYSGEGLTTTFREWKPGTADAMCEGLAPLRLCAFTEPYHVYRGQPIHFEIMLANEDVLHAGEYSLRVDVMNEASKVVRTKQVKVTVPASGAEKPQPFALPVLNEDIAADWPTGKYRMSATFERGAAAAGGVAQFFVTDAAKMAKVDVPVVVWGDDEGLQGWLKSQGIGIDKLRDKPDAARQLIIVSSKLPADAKTSGYRDLLMRLASGSPVLILNGQLLTDAMLQLPCGGRIVGLPSGVYHKEEWNRAHVIFAGLPAGGLMDYAFYRNIIPGAAWQADKDEVPAEIIAGAIHPAPGTGYASGLMMFGDRFGAGRYIVNTLRIRENLGQDPAAERLLRNALITLGSELKTPAKSVSDDERDKIEALLKSK
jgi:hypothetical protein